jgi:hypothetical protein
MKRSVAAVIATVAASASMWLATVPAKAVPANAAPADANPVPRPDKAMLNITPKWAYVGGQFAVTATCSHRGDLRVLFTPLLHLPVIAPGAGNVLFKVTNKTFPGADVIELWCMTRKGAFDAAAAKPVEIFRRLPRSPKAPALPKHFRPDLVVWTTMPQPIAVGPKHRLVPHPRGGHAG